jgi:curved DNA-binding protein CbpA
VTAQFKSDWWIVLGVAPSASKDEIVRKYRHKIKQYHPDRLVGVAPEQAKDLNEAYANAMRTRRHGTPDVAAA